MLLRLIRSYRDDFLATLSAAPDALLDPASALARAAALPSGARDLLDMLLLASGAGEAVDPRLRPEIDAEGEALWQGGFLLPRTRPDPGARIDPRHYAASCRINPALARRLPLAESLPTPASEPAHPSAPTSDARFDAAVVAAAMDASPLALTRSGAPRKDALERTLTALGPDRERWSQALRYARATGMVRPAAGKLFGYPESRPRRPEDPASLLVLPAAGQTLLRLLSARWLDLEAAITLLRDRCRHVIYGPAGSYPGRPSLVLDDAGWAAVEAPALRRAAASLHRLRVLDAALSSTGVQAIRTASPAPRLAMGFLLTPDLDVLIAPGELSPMDYGRLCRLAPYVDGDRVHRHRLTREGVAAELRAGHEDAPDFLREHSRTGLPQSVEATIRDWARATGRVTLLSGVTVVERDGTFTVGAPAPAGARVIDYGERPPARYTWVDEAGGLGEIRVAFGQDALPVRHAVAGLAEPLTPGPDHHRYRIVPDKPEDGPGALAALKRFGDGELPGAMEAAVLAAGAPPTLRIAPATLVQIPAGVMAALRRDPVAGPLLVRAVSPQESAVYEADLPALRARLSLLGILV